MIVELLFIVDLLQRKGLHQTESKGKGWSRFGKPRSQAPQPVVTVASPVEYTITMPVNIGKVDPMTAAKDYTAAATGRPESMKKKIATGRL